MRRKTLPELASVTAAHEAYEEAARALVAAMEAALPMGAWVEIPGRFGPNPARGVIVGYGSWWSEPTSISLRLDSNGEIYGCHIGHLIPEPSDV